MSIAKIGLAKIRADLRALIESAVKLEEDIDLTFGGDEVAHLSVADVVRGAWEHDPKLSSEENFANLEAHVNKAAFTAASLRVVK